MMKETEFFRKQAVKAERMARSASGAGISQSFLNMAKACRSQADVPKAKPKFGKKAALTNSGLFSNGEWPNSAIGICCCARGTGSAKG
jgi:hypothetical protein